LATLLQSQECRSILAQARQAYDSRSYQTAVLQFTKAAAVCGEQPPILLGLAQSNLMLQQFSGALVTIDQLLALEPGNTAALKLKGDVLYLAGRDAEAESALLRAIEIDPKDENSRYALGRIYYQLNRFPDAARQFQTMLELDPKSYRAHDNLALTYEAMNQDNLALKHYFRALDLVHKDHPQYEKPYANLANFFLGRDENEKAFQLAAEAAKRNPSSARNFFLTGKALFKLEKHDLAVRWLAESARLDPAYPEPRYLLAQIYRRQGRTEDADRELAVFRELSKTRPRR
jgi:tetratricopeptide (TPR) repeat protein